MSLGSAEGTQAQILVAPRAIAHPFPEVLLPKDIADELGLAPVSTQTLLELSEPMTEQQRMRATELARSAEVPFSIHVATPGTSGDGFAQVLLISGGIATLIALAIAVATAALAATESDRDLRTMSAVGADPRLRPRFRALQTAYHVTLGVVLAIPAGLLLAMVFQQVNQYPPRTVVPFAAITGLALLCPLLVAIPFRLFSRSATPQPQTRRPT